MNFLSILITVTNESDFNSNKIQNDLGVLDFMPYDMATKDTPKNITKANVKLNLVWNIHIMFNIMRKELLESPFESIDRLLLKSQHHTRIHASLIVTAVYIFCGCLLPSNNSSILFKLSQECMTDDHYNHQLPNQLLFHYHINKLYQPLIIYYICHKSIPLTQMSII